MTDLGGVAVATVTPFSPGGEGLDLDFISMHFRMLEREGAQGVVPSGTNGEFPSLTFDEKRQLLAAAAAAKGEMFMIAGVGSCSYREVIELSEYAGEVGADAILAVPPYYFSDISDRGVLAYYSRILDALGPPLILYNIPLYTGVPITNSVIDKLQEHPKLIGIKDTGGDPERTRELIRRYPSLKIFGGSDSLVGRSLAAGAAGVISGVGNVFPGLLRDVWDARVAGADIMEAAQKVSDARSVLKAFPWVAATKYCLELRGLPETVVRPPLDGLDVPEKEEIKERLRQLGLWDSH